MPRKLRSDDLGEIGERFFPNYIDPRVNFNDPKRDKSGWDALLEFPAEDNSTTLDERPPNKKIFIQVKTVFEDTKNVSCNLSTIEKIAKHELPSGILVLLVNRTTEQVTQVKYIEFLDIALERVLKSLREHSYKSESILGKKISFSINKYGENIDLSERYEISNYLDSLVSDYLDSKSKKKKQLADAGFTLSELKISFEPDDRITKEDFANFLLGEKKLSPSKVVVSKTRFGIPVVNEVLKKSQGLEIQAGMSTTVNDLRLEVGSKKLDKKLFFEGSLSIVDPKILSSDFPPLKFENALFKFISGVRLNEAEFTFSFFNGKILDPEDIYKSGLVRSVLESNDSYFEFVDETGKTLVPFEMASPPESQPSNEAIMTWLYGSSLVKLKERSGVNRKYSFTDLRKYDQEIMTLLKLVGFDVEPAKISFPDHDQKMDYDKVVKQFGKVELGEDKYLIYSEVAKIEHHEGYGVILAKDIRLKEAILVDAFTNDKIEEFKNKYLPDSDECNHVVLFELNSIG